MPPKRASGLHPTLGLEWCYPPVMRPVEALYENGLLRPAKPLNLSPGERVGVIVVRHPDPARWDLTRLAGSPNEDLELAGAGLGEWDDLLAREDQG
jgi:predicted DNA-binding antitoxin AbrB/MazE fold protein